MSSLFLSRVKASEFTQRWSVGPLEVGGWHDHQGLLSDPGRSTPSFTYLSLCATFSVFAQVWGPEAGTGVWINGEIVQNSGRNEEVLCSGSAVFLGGW